MQLSRMIQTAGLALSACGFSVKSPAQTVSAPHAGQKDIQPFVSIAFGPSQLVSTRFNHGAGHPAIDIALGARKRIAGVFGVVVSANYGRMLNADLPGGEDAICRLPANGAPGCLPLSPVLDWFGASAGGEAYLGRAILGLQFGPTAIGTPRYERELVAGSPSREWGLRTQFDANFPVYRQLGVTLSLVDRYIPNILNDRWHVRTFAVGLSLREFSRLH